MNEVVTIEGVYYWRLSSTSFLELPDERRFPEAFLPADIKFSEKFVQFLI